MDTQQYTTPTLDGGYLALAALMALSAAVGIFVLTFGATYVVVMLIMAVLS